MISRRLDVSGLEQSRVPGPVLKFCLPQGHIQSFAFEQKKHAVIQNWNLAERVDHKRIN